jgi:nitrogen fixation/metabolism regulation signal transduction histidine kinase
MATNRDRASSIVHVSPLNSHDDIVSILKRLETNLMRHDQRMTTHEKELHHLQMNHTQIDRDIHHYLSPYTQIILLLLIIAIIFKYLFR